MSQQSTREQFDQLMVPNYRPQPIVPVRGRGSRIWDQNGDEYIDFAGGIATNVLGHCHPELVQTLQHQSEQLWHLSNVFTNEPALKLAQLLVEASFAERVFFANSGAEANEAAFKLARRYAYDHFGQQKHQLIAFEQSFHGRTLFTVSVGGQPKYKEGFEPTPQGITHLPFNDIQALEQAISDNCCAVVMEPIQGEGGVIPADPDFVQAARRLCNQHQSLLVFDEVQTGIGRTGSLFAYQQLGVTPDILTSAKALGGGFPIGAMLTRSKIADSLAFGTHGSTFGGNPLACAVASKVIELVNQTQLFRQVGDKEQRFRQGLARIRQQTGLIKQVRGQGLLLGAELIDDWHGRAGEILSAAREQGLLLLMAGPNVLRFAPSLIIEDELIDQGLERLTRALETLTCN